MSIFFRLFSLFIFITSFSLNAREDYQDDDYRLQLYGDVFELYLGNDEKDKAIYYKAQNSLGPYLYLGANEVFFTPSGVLRSSGSKYNSKMSLNQNKEFSYVTNFRRDGHGMEWGFITSKSGEVILDSFLSGTDKDLGMIFSIQIDDGPYLEVQIDQDMLADQKGFRLIFPETIEEGFHKLKITLKKSAKKATLKFLNARLSGSAIEDSYVVRERWRPLASYSTFRSSVNPLDAQAWIIELSSDSDFGHYSPITTDFGYYGPIFKPGGLVSGVNMSIWSYGAGQQEPPLPELSHLLGIGSAKGTFSSWGHEGTGVKVRNWNPFDSNKSKKHVLGLRFVNEGDYRTFYGYFWNESTKKWQLYSVGRKHKKGKGSLKRIKTNAFIEVVGGADRQRSNHKVREVEYKGWVRDSQGVWSELDEMLLNTRGGIKNENHGLSEDGESLMSSAGGLRNRITSDFPSVIRKNPVQKLPAYMSRKKLKDFDRLPFAPVILSASYLAEDGVLRAKLRVRTPYEAKVTLCWGDEDALTLEKRWDHCKEYAQPAGRRKRVHLMDLPATEEDRYLRVLVRDKRAQMWSFETKIRDE